MNWIQFCIARALAQQGKSVPEDYGTPERTHVAVVVNLACPPAETITKDFARPRKQARRNALRRAKPAKKVKPAKDVTPDWPAYLAKPGTGRVLAAGMTSKESRRAISRAMVDSHAERDRKVLETALRNEPKPPADWKCEITPREIRTGRASEFQLVAEAEAEAAARRATR